MDKERQNFVPSPPPSAPSYDYGMDYLGHAVNNFGRCSFMDNGTGDPPTAVAHTAYLLSQPNNIIQILAGQLGVSSVLGVTNAILVPLIVTAQKLLPGGPT